MGESKKISVKLDTKQFNSAIEKANELIDIINKAKALTKDLAYLMSTLDFTPVTRVDERSSAYYE